MKAASREGRACLSSLRTGWALLPRCLYLRPLEGPHPWDWHPHAPPHLPFSLDWPLGSPRNVCRSLCPWLVSSRCQPLLSRHPDLVLSSLQEWVLVAPGWAHPARSCTPPLASVTSFFVPFSPIEMLVTVLLTYPQMTMLPDTWVHVPRCVISPHPARLGSDAPDRLRLSPWGSPLGTPTLN